MKSLCLIVVALSYCLAVNGPHHEDNLVIRALFTTTDINHDNSLSRHELHRLILSFDTNGNSEVSEVELIRGWAERELGPIWDAVRLFQLLDTDASGAINYNPDFNRIFTYFDRNETTCLNRPSFDPPVGGLFNRSDCIPADGHVVEAEFVLQWIKLSA